MKSKILLFFSIIFLNINLFCQSTTLVDFTTSTTLEAYNGNMYTQLFSLPSGTDYYVNQIGVKVASQSGQGKVLFALYDGSGVLLFKSEEFINPGGVDSILLVDVPVGVQELLGGNSYYVGLMYKGSGNLTMKTQTAAVNTGVATLDAYSSFKISVIYPTFSDPIALTNSYGFNMGFVVNAVEKTEDIIPKNDILDFNCASIIELSPNNIYYGEITMPAGENKALRQIGIKTDTCTVDGAVIKFAIYDNENNLLYVTDELSLDLSKPDTSYIAIPEGSITLSASQKYKIAISYNGTKDLPVLKMRIPVSRGLALVNSYSWFDVDNIYPEFPATIILDGAYGFAYGLVLSSEPEVQTNVDNIRNIDDIKIFPSITEDKISLFAENIKEDIYIKIFNVSGQIIAEYSWTENSSKTIDVSKLKSSAYFVQLQSKDFGIKTLKFIKK